MSSQPRADHSRTHSTELSHSTANMPRTPRRFDRGHADASRRALLWVMWGVVIIMASEFSCACACGATLLVAGTLSAAVVHAAALATTPRTRIIAAAVALATVTCPVGAWTAPSTTTTAITTTTIAQGCGGVVRCLQDPQCALCIDAINSTARFLHTVAEFTNIDNALYPVGFFRTLLSTPSCSTNATSPGILSPALLELANVNCVREFGMVVSRCLAAEYACFVTPSCRQCFAALITAAASNDGNNGTKADVLRSPACTDTSPALLDDLAGNCGAGQGSFPVCTFVKQQCASLPECASCMATLGVGDGVGAAQQCPGSTQSGIGLDRVVSTCMASNAAACDFLSQRCSGNEDCNTCLAGMGNGDSAGALAADWSTPACQKAMQNSIATSYLTYSSNACPNISACRIAVFKCVLRYGETCLSCINRSAPLAVTATCSLVLQQYTLDTVCQPCPASVLASVHTINVIVVATTAVGVASAATCIAVASTIAAHGHDRVSMRDRILLGLMMANAVYSTANAIPLNALRAGFLDCGHLAMSFDAIRFGRAWWFCGKYGLVGFELFILGASIRALRYGMLAVPRRTEATMHAACCTLAVLGLVLRAVRPHQRRRVQYNNGKRGVHPQLVQSRERQRRF
jgi:hypothetical protein